MLGGKNIECEILLQISIENVIDICNIIISGLKLGIPSDEDIIFDKLRDKKVISMGMKNILIEMKGFRNILVHKYGKVDNERVFENIGELDDFDKFKEEIIRFLKQYTEEKVGEKSRK